MTARLACATILTIAVGFGSAYAQSAPSRSTPKRPAAPSAPVDTRRTQPAAPPMDTHLFVVQAALSNMAEIQLGHVATMKAQRADIKKFAQVLIEDHVNTQKGLAEAAYGAGIKWPTQINDQQRQLKQRLSMVKNDQFDREYLRAIVNEHRDIERMLAEQMNENARATDPALAVKVNQWAVTTLPAVRARLKLAEQMYAELDRTDRSARR
jgi:putative membrane protein